MVKILPHGTGPSHMQVIPPEGSKKSNVAVQELRNVTSAISCIQPAHTDLGFVIFGFKLWHVSCRLLKVSANLDSGSSGSLCLYHNTIESLRDYRSPYTMTIG